MEEVPTHEDIRNQRIVRHLNEAQFRYKENGEDKTNSLNGGAAWARLHMAALDSTMPAGDFGGVSSYSIENRLPNGALGLYNPSSKSIRFQMAYPKRDAKPEVQAQRDVGFGHAVVHEHGHHVDNMIYGGLQGSNVTIGQLEGRAENYAEVHSKGASTYDESVKRSRVEPFMDAADPEGWRSLGHYVKTREAGEMPDHPRRYLP